MQSEQPILLKRRPLHCTRRFGELVTHRDAERDAEGERAGRAEKRGARERRIDDHTCTRRFARGTGDRGDNDSSERSDGAGARGAGGQGSE